MTCWNRLTPGISLRTYCELSPFRVCGTIETLLEALSPAITNTLFKRYMRCQLGTSLFLDWQDSEIFAVLSAQHPALYLPVLERGFKYLELGHRLVVFLAPYISYSSILLRGQQVNNVLWLVCIAKHCVLIFCVISEGWYFRVLLDLCYNQWVWLYNDHVLGIISLPAWNVVPCITHYETFCLL